MDKKRPPPKKSKWVQKVMASSDALDLEPGVFQHERPEEIAHSLKASALKSGRRKGTPLQSAMSMLNFHLNRSGRQLARQQRQVLQRAKNHLRRLFGRPPK